MSVCAPLAAQVRVAYAEPAGQSVSEVLSSPSPEVCGRPPYLRCRPMFIFRTDPLSVFTLSHKRVDRRPYRPIYFGRTRIRRTVAATHHFDHKTLVSRDRTDSHLSDGPQRVDHVPPYNRTWRDVRSHTCRRLSDHENSIRAVSRTTIAASNATYPHIQTVIPHHLTDAGVPRRLRPLHTKHFTIFSLPHVIINPSQTVRYYTCY